MDDLTRVDLWSLVQWRMELRFEGVDPDGDELELHEMTLEQLARWLALTNEICARRPHRCVPEGEKIAFARHAISERLQWLAEAGQRSLPPELEGIPLDPGLIPPEFRQDLTAVSDREMVAEFSFSPTAGGAL